MGKSLVWVSEYGVVDLHYTGYWVLGKSLVLVSEYGVVDLHYWVLGVG